MRALIAMTALLIGYSTQAQSVAGCRAAVDQARQCCAHPENCLTGDAQKLYDSAKKDDQKAIRESEELQVVFTKKCDEHIRDCHNRCEGVTRDDTSSLLKQCEGFAELAMRHRETPVASRADRMPAHDTSENPVPDEAQPDPIH